MEETLKRLLAAESRATEIARAAEEAADALLQATLREIKHQEVRLNERIPELRSSYMQKAEQRAGQSIKEMERRYTDRLGHLRSRAESFEDEALSAAFAYLIGNGK